MRCGLVGWMLGAEPARVVRLEGSWWYSCVSHSLSRQEMVLRGALGFLSSLDDEACQDRAGRDDISNLTLGILQLEQDGCPGVSDPLPSIRQLATEIAQSSESVHVDIRRSLLLLAPNIAFDMAHQRFPCGHHQHPVQDEVRPASQQAARGYAKAFQNGS
jgi:hypothetical protein